MPPSRDGPLPARVNLAYYVSRTGLKKGFQVGTETIDSDTIRTLGRVAGIEIPDEDLAPLVALLTQHLASIDELPCMEITDVEPPLVFRATWDD
jgi:hypothetical protein